MAHASDRSFLFPAHNEASHIESCHGVAVADSPCQGFPRKKPRLTIDPMQSQKQSVDSTSSIMSSVVPRPPQSDLEGTGNDSFDAVQLFAGQDASPDSMYSNSPEQFLWNNFTTLGPASHCPPDTLDPGVLVPGFIQPLPMLNPHTMECLYTNGVFSLPSVSLQNSLLQAFVECVLPSMPIVEWQGILNAIDDRSGGRGSVSLLLYYAIVFSATTFVDLGHLHDAGFTSRHEAHEAFFHKTRLLYQSNVERDPLAIVQALLLMTHRLDTADGDDSRHLISIAISTGHSFGLFQSTPEALALPYCPKLWRKIAWTCYSTDCQIALRLRRRPIIKDADFSHPILHADDFDHFILSPQNRILDPSCTLAWNIQVQRNLSDMCIANARLCICIRDVLNVQAKDTITPTATPTSPTSDTSDDPEYTTRAHASETKLAEWASSLPPSCHCHPAEPSSVDEDPMIFTQRRLLHMKFYTAIAVFHQSQPFPWSKFCIQHAAHQITRTASELYQRNLHNRLPLVGVTSILVALVIHVSQMRGPRIEEKDKAAEDFQYALAIMASLRDLYREASSVTAWALKILENVVFNEGAGKSGHDR